MPAPVNSAQNGGICPAGFACPKGTSQPVPCPNGTYASSTGIDLLFLNINLRYARYQSLSELSCRLLL